MNLADEEALTEILLDAARCVEASGIAIHHAREAAQAKLPMQRMADWTDAKKSLLAAITHLEASVGTVRRRWEQARKEAGLK